MIPLILAAIGGYFITSSMKQDKKVYADGGELDDADLKEIVLKSFKDEEGFDFGYESGRSYRYKSEDYTAKKSVNYNGEDYTVEFRVKVMYEAEGAATIEELTVDGIDVDLELFSKEDREEVETFFDDMSENIGQGYAKGGMMADGGLIKPEKPIEKMTKLELMRFVQKIDPLKNFYPKTTEAGRVQAKTIYEKYLERKSGKMADGGEVKWQDARIGDSARVKSENKMGVIKKDYGRKFHLKFVDGTEKTYDASELEFIKDEYADGRELEWGEDLGNGFSVGNDVIVTASGKTGYISGLSGKDLLVTITEDGEDMNVVVSKRGVKMLDAPEYAKGGKMVSKGELVWRNWSSFKKNEFLNEYFTPQETQRSLNILVAEDFQFLPKDVKIKLESMYYMAKGGGVKDKFKGKNSKEVWNNLDFSTRAKVLEYLFTKEKSGDKQYYDSYNSLNEISYNEWDKLPKNIKKEIENFEKGGYMEGGNIQKLSEYDKYNLEIKFLKSISKVRKGDINETINDLKKAISNEEKFDGKVPTVRQYEKDGNYVETYGESTYHDYDGAEDKIMLKYDFEVKVNDSVFVGRYIPFDTREDALNYGLKIIKANKK